MLASKSTKPLSRKLSHLIASSKFSALDALHDGISLDFVRNRFHVKAPGRPAQQATDITQLFTLTSGNQSYYRGSNGLLIPSATNTPRIEYDANGNLLGLLIEGARTNLCLQSQTFNTTWARARILAFGSGSVADATTAPDGTSTADLIVEDSTAANTHLITQAFTKAASALAYSFSVWVKAKERTQIQLMLHGTSGANNGAAIFTLSGNGTAGTPTGNFTSLSASIAAYANGWYRCVLMATSNTDTNLNTRLSIAVTDSTTYSGDGASGLYVWGAQLEQASFASSYIPTTTGSVARTADACSRVFGLEVSQLVGTIVTEFDLCAVNLAAQQTVAALDDGTASELLRIRQDSNEWTIAGVIDGGVNQANIVIAGTPDTARHKAAFVYAANDVAACLDGSAVGVDATATMPTTTTLWLGARANPTAHIFGHIRRLDYWPERKSNAFLQQITT